MHRKAVNHLKRVDKKLAGMIAKVGPCRFRPITDGTHFQFIVRAMVFQQLSTKAARAIHGRLCEALGGPPAPASVLRASDATLRAAGLSRQKLGYLRDLAARVDAGTVVLEGIGRLTDDAAIAELTKVKGIGVWSAQMFLIFRLGRPDVLPGLDLGIRKGIQRAYGLRALPSPERVGRIGAPWSPHATVACWYLWRSLDGPAG